MERIELTTDESRTVAELVHRVHEEYDGWDAHELVGRCEVEAEALPQRLRRFLVTVRSHEAELAVVSGLPLSGDLAPTPSGWDAAAKTGAGTVEEVLLLICSAALAQPFGWSSQQDGRMVHDVCPSRGMEKSLTSASSSVPLSLHTEDVFHDCRADYVALFCLRNPHDVATELTRISRVDVPPELRVVLSEDRFRFYPDDSHLGKVLIVEEDRGALAKRQFTTGSVLFGPAERPYLRFDVDFMAAEREGDRLAEEAITAMQELLASSVEKVVLKPGDLGFIDNHQGVHGRSPFTANFDGTDRWLKRVNLTRDIRRVYTVNRSRSRVLG
ncbi:Fe(II)-2OG oxygenase family protein [Micromonospora siamensis]|uniref:Arginine beta-hydroxylase, Fe(II)/alpha-ketoglutarate-dependent n=1 Tax=Micromonospora siamensis TaxID=299152 RepID=A0A1C5HEJ8_9ACTN|nr:oxygenase [Micromonospora siamensis]SCG44426.1 arginine beta-hydroxylase, Fe(II)/alpha-ketoglutarate-dependent [Micromonospora siamensis]